MKLAALLFLTFQTMLAFGVEFNRLSRTEPVTASYQPAARCVADVSFFLNKAGAYNGKIFVRINYVIGKDTLTDHLVVDANFNGVIKQLLLNEGEKVTALVYLENANIEVIEKLEGSIRMVQNTKLIPTDDKGKNLFLSGVWISDQMPLFRVTVTDSVPHLLRLKLTFNESYDYDKLFFNLKVVSKSSGINMVEKELTVTENAVVEARKRSFTIDLTEINLSVAETYYIQVIQNMACNRINGIDRIEHELLKQ
jgi:hypothetical protein